LSNYEYNLIWKYSSWIVHNIIKLYTEFFDLFNLVINDKKKLIDIFDYIFFDIRNNKDDIYYSTNVRNN